MFLLANAYLFSGNPLLSRWDGVILLVCFVAFLYYVATQLKSDPEAEQVEAKDYSTLKIWTLILVGLIGLVGGGKLVVDNAVSMAQTLGVSEKIIGLTIVAAGTSLPELATSVVAAMRKKYRYRDRKYCRVQYFQPIPDTWSQFSHSPISVQYLLQY